jgi:integrase
VRHAAFFELEELRASWRVRRPRPWLFPGGRRGRPLTPAGVQRIVKRAARRAGLSKPVTPPPLRHWASGGVAGSDTS